MKKTQFDTLVIHDFEEKEFHLPNHSHTYYELVYIRKGKGVHLLNNLRLSYSKGDLFILSPDDEHYFEIKNSTHFTFIKFTDSYFDGHQINRPDAFISLAPEMIMCNKLLKEIKLKINEPYVKILHNIVENITTYNGKKNIENSPLIYYQILSIFGLIREEISNLSVRIDNGQPDKEELISYIHQHIYKPSLIQIKNIANHFAISPTYFSDYFKRKFAMNYRNYITEYRMKLIEKRLSVSTLTIAQIADEFGFTDESHFIHFFRKNKNISPGYYRKQYL
jgi:AraC-like DNA-binding protein